MPVPYRKAVLRIEIRPDLIVALWNPSDAEMIMIRDAGYVKFDDRYWINKACQARMPDHHR